MVDNFNWEFKLKDYNATKERHSKRLEKVVLKEADYDVILGNTEETINRIVNRIVNPSPFIPGSMWFKHSFQPDVIARHGLTKSLVLELKRVVNLKTREEIVNSLIAHGYPISYDTAFYLRYYNRINELMEKITKKIVKEHL